jgi:hypothetical protein
MRYVALRSNVTTLSTCQPCLTIALAMSLVPAISAARTAKDQKTIHTVSAMGIKLAMFYWNSLRGWTVCTLRAGIDLLTILIPNGLPSRAR